MILLSAALTGIVLGSSGCASHSSSDHPMGQCHGMNSCKGTGDCSGKGTTCAGKNSCKGMGWMKMDKEDCMDEAGVWQAMK